ncbi:MAG: response regulator [Candidatus Cloacimonetes bacterium]|jgi:DNA-binding response OmpR family regulator|nr:response regulator [Candidatus Cloacimonadota bacterium]MDD4155423.1 response regulator [Candidatus Cloacimonadota bacterium]
MKKNILVVDDEQDIRELISDLLETKGYRILTACDGEDALSKMANESFDLFIIDMSMPRMDGMTLLKEIKKIQPLAVVIVLTGFSSIEGAVNAIQAGAFQYISKPVKAKELFEIVEKALDYSEELYGPLQKTIDTGSLSIDPLEPIILHGFTAEEKAEFYALGKVVTFQIGETIQLSENKNGSIMIIDSGEVSAWMSNSNFDYLKKFDSWGEESIILAGTIPVSLRAESPVTIRFFERKRILDFFSFKGEKLLKRFIINISSSLSLKWRKSIQRIVMLKLVTNND